MSRVRGDGQTVGEDSADDLDDHEQQAEHARDDQLPARPLVHVVGRTGFRGMTMKL